MNPATVVGKFQRVQSTLNTTPMEADHEYSSATQSLNHECMAV